MERTAIKPNSSNDQPTRPLRRNEEKETHDAIVICLTIDLIEADLFRVGGCRIKRNGTRHQRKAQKPLPIRTRRNKTLLYATITYQWRLKQRSKEVVPSSGCVVACASISSDRSPMFGSRATLQAVNLGSEACSKPISWNNSLSPFVGLYADYYFTGDNAAVIALAGAVPLAAAQLLDGWSAGATSVISARFTSGAALAFGAELGGLGSHVQIWTYKGRASLPFSAR